MVIKDKSHKNNYLYTLNCEKFTLYLIMEILATTNLLENING